MKATRVIGLLVKLTLMVALTIVLAGCERAVKRPKMIASYSFSQLLAGEPVGFHLTEIEADTLLIRVDGYETALESSIVDASGATLSSVQLPVLLLGPVFHLIRLDSQSGPFEVRVLPKNVTVDSMVRVRVLALPSSSREDQARLDAYASYERATQSNPVDSHQNRVERINDLRLAAAGFATSEQTEEQLWASFLEACVQYSDQQDHQVAVGQLRRIQERAGRADFKQIRLAAMLLEGKVLITPVDSDSAEEAHAKHVRGQEVLESAADLAAELELPFEQAWAFLARGDGYLVLEYLTFARTMFEQALTIAIAIEDRELQLALRNKLAKIDTTHPTTD